MTSPDPLARVYVAAPCGEAHVANMLRALLLTAGFRVVSRWTDRLRKQSAKPSREEMTAIHRANSAELDDADLVVAWTAAGTPRATYCEISAALTKGKPVLWLQGPNGEGSNSYDTEPFVRVLVVDLATTYLARDVAIVAAVREMAEEQRERAARLVALAKWRPWNTCETCGQPVDIDGESFDGAEVLCHGCNTWNVVVALEGGGWTLEARKPCAACGHAEDAHHDAEDEDAAGCGVPHPVHGWCPCEGYVSADKGAA